MHVLCCGNPSDHANVSLDYMYAVKGGGAAERLVVIGSFHQGVTQVCSYYLCYTHMCLLHFFSMKIQVVLRLLKQDKCTSRSFLVG